MHICYQTANERYDQLLTQVYNLITKDTTTIKNDFETYCTSISILARDQANGGSVQSLFFDTCYLNLRKITFKNYALKAPYVVRGVTKYKKC